ncbi:hypothetical protein [Streptomyces hirsutus]|uniref:hypothetical protein n=1 Tax=Streptomyces hirsutus TaxID=35620 RepID=UPI000A96689D|nr:hypothetical protein [Streptomyces hirsutus]
MSTTPPDMRRGSLHTALGSGAACTAAAFGAGFTLAADQSGSAAPVNRMRDIPGTLGRDSVERSPRETE